MTITFLPDRLNAEPIVFRGFTTPELFITAGSSVIGGLLTAIPFAFLFGWLAFPTIGLLMPLLVIFFGGKLMARYKRGKPENYLYRQLEASLCRYGVGNPSLILHCRCWALRRSRQVIRKENVNEESI